MPSGGKKKWAGPDQACNALTMGVAFVFAGAFALLQETNAGPSEGWSMGLFFLVFGVTDLVIGGVMCWRLGTHGDRLRCLAPPEQRTNDDRSLVRRLLGSLSVPTDVWWPASFLQAGLSLVSIGAVVSIGMLWDAPLSVAMAPGFIAAGLGLTAIGGIWLLIAFLRR